MSELLKHTMFYDVLFPSDISKTNETAAADLTLQKVLRYRLDHDANLMKTPIVIFDFETTGLDTRDDHIVEIGAIKYIDFKPVDEFSTLVTSPIPLSSTITALTGISNEMLEGQPEIGDVLPEFMSFFSGCLLAAHNAEFDMGFLKSASQRLGYQIDWPCFCTLKLARVLLPQLESKNLDTLAKHYNLQFEARHRSVGDVKVTGSVLKHMLEDEGGAIKLWQDLQPIAQIKD